MKCVAIILALVAVAFATKSWDDLRPRLEQRLGHLLLVHLRKASLQQGKTNF